MRAKYRILHLGLGAFHRAHQAAFLQRLIDAGEGDWSLAGGNIRPDAETTILALQQQGGAYTLETVSPEGERQYQTIRAIEAVVPFDPGLTELIRLGADPATRIISFTVTEAGYSLDHHDRPDFTSPDIVADVATAHCEAPRRTIYGALTAILRARQRRGAGAVTLLCCDNLRHNGARFRGGLMQFLDRVDDPSLRNFVAENTTCPNAMVDRITPQTTDAVRARVRLATGWDDAAPVMAESFMQWVIEDNFCNGRPPWERVGVEMVESVTPYEEAKIRILNASHSCIAWAGTLAGYHTIHEGVRDSAIRTIAFNYITEDAIPCLHPSVIDLARYRDIVLARFSNAALNDTNQRVAMDGFAKLTGFIAPTIHERLARNESIASVAMLPALFLAFLMRWHRGKLPFPYRDQAMNATAAHAMCEATDPVRAFCRDKNLWGSAAGDLRLEDAVRAAAARVLKLEFAKQKTLALVSVSSHFCRGNRTSA